ncbi:hypothetical protein PHYSODRAFT_512693 [Phytophthora sojae]|uniref:Uncharacterized protein n=1 Tax=Phytophthora sojae (strain P6497) TaxID=1094619 RepID=G4ZR01_PHYSP|nr:hypothetical protein PHYSODRAFT_512693 [Phytophthora sojae]EGZ14081.1 hypothetical protein PHYSODRAFT_512693 [Phytophthora sojae]|eukprot:XP_009531510.1 hypothetical protein PHYSODRAFT_512693 [Phytophthora sojae]
MKMHAAVWHFADTDGNKYTKKYARKGKGLHATDRESSDSKWLRNHGGKRIRDAWKALSPKTKARLMQETPDDTFPDQSEGILDERTKATPQPTSVAMPSTIRTKRKTNASCKDLTHLRAVLNRNRSKYYSVVCEEEELRIKTAYNNGSLAGVIEAMASGVKNAIYLAHSRDRCQTSTDAFRAVCLRVGDVLTSAMSNTSFPPEPNYDSDAPSPEFAAGRINQAWRNYQHSVKELRSALAQNGVDGDPDPSLLASIHPAFASNTKR